MDLNRLAGMLAGEYRLFTMPIRICLNRYGNEYRTDSDKVLSFVEKLTSHFGDDFDTVLQIYYRFVEEQINLHKEFLITREYRYRAEHQVKQVVSNPEFQKNNLYVLALSIVLAPHRYEMFRYIRSVASANLKPGNTCLEIGTGTGFTSYIASLKGAVIDTYDLNPYAGICLELLGTHSNVHFISRPYLFDDEKRYDFCFLIELLEHVENPLEYLEGVRRVLTLQGKALLTFAIRMPQIDHIYLFTSVTQAQDLIRHAGLEVLDEMFFISSFMEYDHSKKYILAQDSDFASNYACVVQQLK